MPYVDEKFYSEVFMGEPIDNSDFPSLAVRASEIVEEMSMYRVNEITFEDLPEAIKLAFRKAVCAEMEYLDANGGSEVDNGSDFSSASLGRFSYTKGTASEGTSRESWYAPRALRLLAPTGLLYRGGGCY